MKKYTKKPTRREQPIQRYIKKYYAMNMKDEMDAEMAKTEPSDLVKETKSELKSRWFKAFQRITREHWENESDETKEAIAAEIHSQHEKESIVGDVDGDDMELDSEERKPEEYAE
jgi:hypothetical protein